MRNTQEGTPMARLLPKTLSFSLFLLTAMSFCSAQNFMTRRYSVVSAVGPINRGDFNEDGIPDVVFQTPTGVAVALGTLQGTLGTVKTSKTTLPGGQNIGDLVVARFT